MGEARLTFLATLRAGLRGIAPAAIDDPDMDRQRPIAGGRNGPKSSLSTALAAD